MGLFHKTFLTALAVDLCLPIILIFGIFCRLLKKANAILSGGCEWYCSTVGSFQAYNGQKRWEVSMALMIEKTPRNLSLEDGTT